MEWKFFLVQSREVSEHSEVVTNMAPFMPFRVILVIEWQHNTWTNMIVKMTILRLLGSSDDKEIEKISSSVRSTGRTDARGTGASDACRKNRCYDVWCRRKSKPSQPIGTGWTDGPKKGIGALAVLCTRDDVKCPEEVSSAPVQPTVHRCIPPV